MIKSSHSIGTLTHRLLLLCSVSLWGLMASGTYASGWLAPEYLDGASLISADDLMDIRKELSDIVIIDTREGAAVQSTIPGAVHIASRDISPFVLKQLLQDKSTPVVFYSEGEHSNKSYKAAKKAINYGYVNVFWMRGGMEEWIQRGNLTMDVD